MKTRNHPKIIIPHDSGTTNMTAGGAPVFRIEVEKEWERKYKLFDALNTCSNTVSVWSFYKS